MSSPSLPRLPIVSPGPGLRRRRRDPDEDDDVDALEEGELRDPVPVHGWHEPPDDDALDLEVRGPQHHSPRLDFISLLDDPVVLPSPTPSGDCESDATLSDDDYGGGIGWAASASHYSNIISDAGVGQAASTSRSSTQAATHQQPPPPLRRERATTAYTCKECGKTYPTNQALGGHVAGHKNKQREAEAVAAAAAAGLGAAVPHRRDKAGQPHVCRKCGKVFVKPEALGSHMRVHYTGPPIVLIRTNKKRCLAPPPPPAEEDLASPPPPEEDWVTAGLTLSLSIKAEEDLAAAPAPPPAAAADEDLVAAGRWLSLSIETEEEPPSTQPTAAPAGAGRVLRLFGADIDISQQQEQGSGGTTEGSSSTDQQQQDY